MLYLVLFMGDRSKPTFAPGFFMGVLTAVHPESSFRKAFDLRGIHRVLGLSSLGLTTVAVLSGIMDKLPNGKSLWYISDLLVDVAWFMLPLLCV